MTAPITREIHALIAEARAHIDARVIQHPATTAAQKRREQKS